MGILNTFIEQASNIWWGIIAAIVVVAVLYLILYMMFGGSKSFSPLGFVFAVPLLPLLAIQFFLLFGSLSVKHSCTEAAAWIDALIPEQSFDGSYSREDIREGTSKFVAAFPLFSTLVDTEDISPESGYTLGESLTRKIQTYLNWYIVRRVAWTLGFVVVAILGVVLLQAFTPSSRPSRQIRPYRERQRPSRRIRR